MGGGRRAWEEGGAHGSRHAWEPARMGAGTHGCRHAWEEGGTRQWGPACEGGAGTREGGDRHAKGGAGTRRWGPKRVVGGRDASDRG